MNTYICSVYNNEDICSYTEVIQANSYNQAIDKIRRTYDEENEYDLLEYEEFIDKLFENSGILLGEVLDIEELTPTIV